MNVLSLFDGISCGQLALLRSGIKADKYFASEIDPNAIKIANKNFPNTIQIGDVTTVKGKNIDNIKLLLGGSPCQDLSICKADRDRTGLRGSKSNLFFEYYRLFTECNPKYFLFENVDMKEEDKNIITTLLGVEPKEINSNLITAQDRKRLYWTNIPYNNDPVDKKLFLKDIVIAHTLVPNKYWYDKEFEYHGEDNKIQCTLNIKTHEALKRVYNLNNKCGTLTCVSGGYQEKKIYQNGRCRKLMPIEYERLQTLPDNYTESLCDSKRYTAIGNGWTVDIISHILNGIKEDN